MPDRQLTAVPPDELSGIWHQVRPGLEGMAHLSDGWIQEDVFCACRQGGATLYMAVEDGQTVGFVVLRLLAGYRGPEVLVWCAYSLADGPLALLSWGEQIERIARDAGARRLTFQSPRKGWEKRAADLGYRPVQTVYAMEL